MKKLLAIFSVVCLSVIGLFAITNLVLVVTLSDDQHTNLVAIAEARGQTPEQFLRSTNMGLATQFSAERDRVLLRTFLQLWETAPISNKLAAIQALQP